MKCGVIGLGRFGYHVATVLAENGTEVLAVDSSESIVASIRDLVTHAVCLRVTDEESLRSIGIDEMDTVIVAMGENFAQSILATALIKKHLKVPRVITRAINDIHKEILNLVGADRVILPEREIGINLAEELSSPFSYLTRLSRDFAISQIEAPARFVGKTIEQLDLAATYNVAPLGIRTQDTIEIAQSKAVIKKDDKIIVAGSNEALEEFSNR